MSACQGDEKRPEVDVLTPGLDIERQPIKPPSHSSIDFVCYEDATPPSQSHIGALCF